MWSNIFALSGLVLALVGSLYLTVRIFARIRSLQDITGVQISDQITHIASTYRNAQSSSDPVGEIIEFLNLVFIDFESAQADTVRRSYIGIGLLVVGTLLQSIAVVLVIVK